MNNDTSDYEMACSNFVHNFRGSYSCKVLLSLSSITIIDNNTSFTFVQPLLSSSCIKAESSSHGP